MWLRPTVEGCAHEQFTPSPHSRRPWRSGPLGCRVVRFGDARHLREPRRRPSCRFWARCEPSLRAGRVWCLPPCGSARGHRRSRLLTDGRPVRWLIPARVRPAVAPRDHRENRPVSILGGLVDGRQLPEAWAEAVAWPSSGAMAAPGGMASTGHGEICRRRWVTLPRRTSPRQTVFVEPAHRRSCGMGEAGSAAARGQATVRWSGRQRMTGRVASAASLSIGTIGGDGRRSSLAAVGDREWVRKSRRAGSARKGPWSTLI
jgi:hypothetical protein